MVVASVSLAAQRYELKTVEGGYVELRRMSYGKKLDRAEQATQTSMKGSAETQKDDVEMLMAIMQRRVAELEFAECITEHNLENANTGQPFDFKDPNSFNQLDPQIGEEISTLISSMNNYEGEMTQVGNSPTVSKDTSS